MAAYLPVVRVCTAQSREALTTGKYAAITPTTSIIKGHDRTITVILAKHCIKLPDDGSLVIRNMLERF